MRINGQQTFELRGTSDPRTLRLSGLSPALITHAQSKMKQVGASSEQVTIYLTSAGVPVRILTVLSTSRLGTIAGTEDIGSINEPVNAARPALSQTISYARLEHLNGH